MSGVKIKPLVWVAGRGMFDEWNAETPLGKFRILRRNDHGFVSVYMAPFQWENCPLFTTVPEAKAACEQEYERRVRECLVHEDDQLRP